MEGDRVGVLARWDRALGGMRGGLGWRGCAVRGGRVGGFFFSSRRRHTRLQGDWSSDVCSSDLGKQYAVGSEEPDLPTAYRLPPTDVLDVLNRLVDKSLVVADRATAGRRYRLLE